jgi:hypothetical protein
MSRQIRTARREAIERKHLSLHNFDDIEMLPVLVGGEIEQRQVTCRDMGLPLFGLEPSEHLVRTTQGIEVRPTGERDE